MNRYFVVGTLLAMLMPHAAIAADTAAARAPAANAGARVAETRYDSAFTGYTPYREQKPASWRELNDDAHKAGGHVGIFGGAHAQHGTKPAPATTRQERKSDL